MKAIKINTISLSHFTFFFNFLFFGWIFYFELRKRESEKNMKNCHQQKNELNPNKMTEHLPELELELFYCYSIFELAPNQNHSFIVTMLKT